LSRADSVGNASFNLNWDSLVGLFNDDFGHILTFFYFLLFTFLLIPGIKNIQTLRKASLKTKT